MEPIEVDAKVAFDIVVDGQYYKRVKGVLVEIEDEYCATYYTKNEDLFEASYALCHNIINHGLEEEFDLWLAKYTQE